MGSSRSAAFCRSPRRPITPTHPARQSREAAGPGPARYHSEDRNPARVRGEFPRLSGPEGLATASPGRDRGRPLQRGAADADDGPAGRRAGHEGADHNQQCGSPLSARSRQSAVHSVASERPVGIRLYLRHDLGRFRLCRLRHRRLCASVGVSRARRTPVLCWTRWSKPCMSAGPSGAAASSIHSDRGVPYLSIKYTEQIYRANIPSGWPKRASSRRSAASATVTTMPSPKPSTASTKPR
jgi:hypothetical protein